MSLKEYIFGFACEDRAAEFLRGEGFEILKAAEFYLMSCDTDEPWQIDVVEVYPRGIKFITNVSF